MTQITHLRQIVQVRKKRACGYATVDLIQPDGSLRKREKPLVVHFPEHAQGAATAGSLWEVSGRERENAFTTANGLIISEYTIDATEIRFLKPLRILINLNTHSVSFEHPELLTHCPV